MAAYCLLPFMMSFHEFCDHVMLCKCMCSCKYGWQVHVPVQICLYVYCSTRSGIFLRLLSWAQFISLHLGFLRVTSFYFYFFYFFFYFIYLFLFFFNFFSTTFSYRDFGLGSSLYLDCTGWVYWSGYSLVLPRLGCPIRTLLPGEPRFSWRFICLKDSGIWTMSCPISNKVMLS